MFAAEVVAVDRGFTARLERKIGAFPTHERKQRTNERVNDEIMASIVVTLREAGLEAQPGSEDTLSLKDDAVVVIGRLHARDPASAAVKNNQIGFGAGRGGVVADMTVTHFSSGGRKQLMAFTAELASGHKPPPAARNWRRRAMPRLRRRLPPATPPRKSCRPRWKRRRAGSAARPANKIVAFAKEQGWLAKAGRRRGCAGAEPVKPRGPNRWT